MTNHHDHDMARLAELAASDPEGAEARAMVDECAECAEELRLQIEAVSLLGELPPAKLTEAERSRVRQGVWESLQPDIETPAPVTEPTPVRSSPPWYTRVVGAAAALVVLAGLGYFLVDNPLLGGGGDSAESGQAASTTSASADEEADDTADMAAEAAPDTAPSAGGTDETADRDDTEEETAATTAAEETMAAAETTASAEAPDDTLTSDAATVSQVLDPVVAEAVDRVVARLRDTAQDRTPQAAGRLDLSRPELSCLESLGLDEVLAADSITAGDRRLMVVSHQIAETVEVEVFDLADCSRVSTSNN